MPAARWNDAYLNAMRQVGDPPSDMVIAGLSQRHGIEQVNAVMRSLVRNDDLVPDELPASVRSYLAETETLPEWADADTILRGEAFFDDNWPVIVTLLFCASLPSAYAAHKGAQVLYLTQRMTDHVHRRIFETAQFILDVMAPGGLSASGRGIRSAQKVRLMHSAIRHLIQYDERWQAQWDDAWGVPINQEDLAGTLMTFSLQILIGMERFRIPMTRADREAYLHAWKVVGHIMGIDAGLMPADIAEANELARVIFDRQKGPSEAGSELTRALLGFMDDQLPGRFLDGFPATLMRQSIDGGVADLLNIPRSDWTLALFRVEEVLWRALARLQLLDGHHSRLLEWLSFRIVQALVKIERGGNRSLFRIPPNLRAPV